jgi:hypothetical protein
VVDRLSLMRRDHLVDHIFCLGEMQIEPGHNTPSHFTVLGPVLGRRRIVGEILEVLREELSSVTGRKAIRTGDADALAPGDPLYHRGRTFLGIPSCEPLRERFRVTTCDIDRTSRHGWSVLQTVLPFDGRAVADAIAVLAAGVAAWGVPLQPHLTSVSACSINLMTMIWFERTPEGIERMRGLRDELAGRLADHGDHPSREGVDMLYAASARSRDDAWAQIKAAFDPRGIIAPGRYVSGTTAPPPAFDEPPASDQLPHGPSQGKSHRSIWPPAAGALDSA